MPKKMSLLDKIVKKMDISYDKMDKYHKEGKDKLTEIWYKKYDDAWLQFKKHRTGDMHWTTYKRWWDKTQYIPLSKRKKR